MIHRCSAVRQADAEGRVRDDARSLPAALRGATGRTHVPARALRRSVLVRGAPQGPRGLPQLRGRGGDDPGCVRHRGYRRPVSICLYTPKFKARKLRFLEKAYCTYRVLYRVFFFMHF